MTQPALALTLTQPAQEGAGGKKRASEPDGQDGQSKKPRLTEDDDVIILQEDHQAKDIDISIDGNRISSPLMGSVKIAVSLAW